MLSQNNINDIIKRISNRISELELSYQDLSDKTGIAKSTLQRYITGNIKNIKLDKVEVLAKALNITPEYLMGWEPITDKTDDLNVTSTIHEMLKTMVNQGLIKDVNNMPENIQNMILEITKIEIQKIIDNRK